MDEGPSLSFHGKLGGVFEATGRSERSCRRGESCGVGHGATPFGGNETASSPTVMIAGTDFLELAARPLPLRLRFLVASVLRDRGRVTPWSFWRRKVQVQYESQSLLTVGKGTNHTRCTAVDSAGHAACPPPLGGYPTNETLPDPPEAATMTVASPEMGDLRSTRSTPPDVPMARAPFLWGRIGPNASLCGRTPNNVGSSRRRAEPSPLGVRMDCRRVCVLRRPRVSSGIRACAPPEPFLLPKLRGMSKGHCVGCPLS